MIIDLHNNLYLKVIIYPLLIFLSLLIIQFPNNRTNIDQFNFSEFYKELDTNNNQEESESNYEYELDDFINNKQNKSQLYHHYLTDNNYKIIYPEIIYLDTPYHPPESV